MRVAEVVVGGERSPELQAVYDASQAELTFLLGKVGGAAIRAGADATAAIGISTELAVYAVSFSMAKMTEATGSVAKVAIVSRDVHDGIMVQFTLDGEARYATKEQHDQRHAKH